MGWATHAGWPPPWSMTAATVIWTPPPSIGSTEASALNVNPVTSPRRCTGFLMIFIRNPDQITAAEKPVPQSRPAGGRPFPGEPERQHISQD